MSLHSFASPPQPFTIAIPQKDVDDLNSRLEHARWPLVDTVPDDLTPSEKAEAFGCGFGPTLGLMKQLAEGWKAYSWREKERELNS